MINGANVFVCTSNVVKIFLFLFYQNLPKSNQFIKILKINQLQYIIIYNQYLAGFLLPKSILFVY